MTRKMVNAFVVKATRVSTAKSARTATLATRFANRAAAMLVRQTRFATNRVALAFAVQILLEKSVTSAHQASTISRLACVRLSMICFV